MLEFSANSTLFKHTYVFLSVSQNKNNGEPFQALYIMNQKIKKKTEKTSAGFYGR